MYNDNQDKNISHLICKWQMHDDYISTPLLAQNKNDQMKETKLSNDEI